MSRKRIPLSDELDRLGRPAMPRTAGLSPHSQTSLAVTYRFASGPCDLHGPASGSLSGKELMLLADSCADRDRTSAQVHAVKLSSFRRYSRLRMSCFKDLQLIMNVHLSVFSTCILQVTWLPVARERKMGCHLDPFGCVPRAEISLHRSSVGRLVFVGDISCEVEPQKFCSSANSKLALS